MNNHNKLKISIFFSLSFSIFLLFEYSNIKPLIHPEKVANLIFLWSEKANWFKSLYSSCNMDACIGRFRPLNYLLEYIDAIYLKSIMHINGSLSWKPLTTITTIILAPSLFLIFNKKNLFLALFFIALFFSSFQFLSNYYNYFRPGKEFSLLILIPILSYILYKKEKDIISSNNFSILLVTGSLLDEQVAFFLFFLLFAYMLKNKFKNIKNSISIAFLWWVSLYFLFTGREKLTVISTYKYLKTDSYSTKDNVIERVHWLYSHFVPLSFETLKFIFLNNTTITILALVGSLGYLIKRKIKNARFNEIDKKSVFFFLSGFFIFIVSAFFHPAIVIGKTQGLAYYLIIPVFLMLYGIYTLYSEFKFNKILIILTPLLLIFIVYINLKNVNKQLAWVNEVWETASESNKINKNFDFHSWQRGAQLTIEANNGCKNYAAMNLNEIEQITFKKYVCEFLKK